MPKKNISDLYYSFAGEKAINMDRCPGLLRKMIPNFFLGKIRVRPASLE
jgi:hypothetical protein